MNVIETLKLAKRYGRRWALEDCTLALPAGRVVALVGPNGSGKTTLLHLAVGLMSQTSGTVTVLGGSRPGSQDALDRVGFMAQSTALYRNLSVEDALRVGRNLNRRWDNALALERLRERDIPLDRKVGKLSGGQQSQVALALVLAKRPDLLILDEPLAALDPLARHEFMSALMAAVAADGLSVVFSSHVVAELENVCDHLIVLSGGRVQVAGDVDDLTASHQVLAGPAEEAGALAASLPVVRQQWAAAQTQLLVRAGSGEPLPPGWQSHGVGLEELVLAYLREPSASVLPGPRPAATAAAESKGAWA
ncbi:ABC transporter ATP-binding protein [Streptomyces orinoci]|uniref:ABC transporter ATP-binding protein n=1 Tax=Streptomyces orinoci TaxID=67339 RepID=A0ABV3K2E3_STRON|nr:ABC transporter ATP-binding protein [Streptomyces orinoci]